MRGIPLRVDEHDAGCGDRGDDVDVPVAVQVGGIDAVAEILVREDDLLERNRGGRAGGRSGTMGDWGA